MLIIYFKIFEDQNLSLTQRTGGTTVKRNERTVYEKKYLNVISGKLELFKEIYYQSGQLK